MPHSGAVRHSLPRRLVVRPPVGEPVAHVVEEQVGVRVDRLLRERGHVGYLAGVERREMARRASRRTEQLLALLHLVVARRRGAPGTAKRARVEGDASELEIVELGIAAGRRGDALGLGRGAGLLGEEPARDPDVAVERAGVLLLDGRDVGLPPEASEHHLLLRDVPHRVRPSRDAVTVVVVGIGVGEDRAFGHGLEQPDAEHARRDARRHEHVGRERTRR